MPIAVALVVGNGLSPTAVLLPASVLYVVSGLRYGLPVPVQPLKAFGAIAIAEGLGADEIAAGALLMGALFTVLGCTGVLDRVAAWIPRSVIRGVQLAVGLLFLKVAVTMVTDPPSGFDDTDGAVPVLVLAAAGVLAAALLLRRHGVALGLVAVGVVVLVLRMDEPLRWGPSALDLPALDLATLATAFVVLVLPQAPLTLVNSCIATADVAQRYYGSRAASVTPSRLAVSLGLANVFAGGISGMPVCHGAGGMTAHRSFGAQSAAAPIGIGVALLALALVVGRALPDLLVGFPLPVLSGLLAAAGVLHALLLRDLTTRGDRAVAVVVGVLGLLVSIALGVAAGLVVAYAIRRRTAADRLVP